MEIRVYSPSMEFLGVIEDFKSLLWCRKYYEPGNFQLYAPGTDRNIELLQTGNIITKRGSVEAGIIGGHTDEEGSKSNQITRSGNFLSILTARRIIKNTINFSGTQEDAMRYMVGQVTPIPLLELGERKGYAGYVTFQATWKNLQTYLTKMAKSSGLGYRIRPDFRAKKLYFEVYKGVDHSVLQTENPRVIFSRELGNLNDITYTYDDTKYRNVFYIGGQGEGDERKIVILGDAEAEDIREVFIDAKDLKQGDLTEAEYEEALLQRGREKKEDYNIKESIEAEVQSTNFEYKKDWDLGDIVTTKKREWNITLNQRVTEVLESYENGGTKIEPTFGDALPETLDLSED